MYKQLIIMFLYACMLLYYPLSIHYSLTLLNEIEKLEIALQIERESVAAYEGVYLEANELCSCHHLKRNKDIKECEK